MVTNSIGLRLGCQLSVAALRGSKGAKDGHPPTGDASEIKGWTTRYFVLLQPFAGC
jgi:hypothetical protein